MIASLIEDLGLDIEAIVSGSATPMRGPDARTYDVFHVEDARGSPHIPAQREFVVPYGIKSVVGFGGFAGAMGGFLMNLAAGWFRENQGSYVTMFTIAGVIYFVAILAIHVLAPRLEPTKLRGA